jgi:hypothetical protein
VNETKEKKIKEKERSKKSRDKAKKKKITLSGGEEPSTGAAGPHCITTTFGRRITGVPSRRRRPHKPPETATTLPHCR